MDTISFKLDAFEGPLDLLLHLVSKHKLNIYDIEISLLLEQYLIYIEGIETRDYEQAADFLEMAARLIYIKTCYLLPQPEEAEELKKTLQGRMIEYSLCKWAAQRLKEDYAGGTIFVREPVKLPVNKQYTRLHDKQELYEAYLMISAKVKEYKPLRANMFSPIVAKRIVSVESKITEILERLYLGGSFEMSHLYDGMKERSERIAAFLAVLELTKSGRIFLNDDNTRIELRRQGEQPDSDDETAADNTDNGYDVGNTDNTDHTENTENTENTDNTDDTKDTDSPEAAVVSKADDLIDEVREQAYAADAPSDTVTADDIDEPDASEEASAAAEEQTHTEEDKPSRSYSMQLAQSIYTATLRVDKHDMLPEKLSEMLPEDVGEFVSLFDETVGEFVSHFDEQDDEQVTEDEPQAVAAFLPIVTIEAPIQEAHDNTDDEPYRITIKPNYYARRYYWGCAPLADGRRSFRAAWDMRI